MMGSFVICSVMECDDETRIWGQRRAVVEVAVCLLLAFAFGELPG